MNASYKVIGFFCLIALEPTLVAASFLINPILNIIQLSSPSSLFILEDLSDDEHPYNRLIILQDLTGNGKVHRMIVAITCTFCFVYIFIRFTFCLIVSF